MSNPLERDPFESLADLVEDSSSRSAERAPSALKSRIYSMLVRKQQSQGPLAPLSRTKAAGYELCVFEDLVQIAPVGERLQSFNCCSVCHARVVAERFEEPPIWWPGCPYVKFQNG